MRWKLLRRKLSVSSPRVSVRSHLPWPLRWLLVALVMGFSAAIALWAFEFGKDIAGLDESHARPSAEARELSLLRDETQRLRAENERAAAVANTADSLLKAERATQEKLAESVRRLEAEVLDLKTNLAFFERLLPASGQGLAVRALRAEEEGPGQLRYQLLLMQGGKAPEEFLGRYEITASGMNAGKPWSTPAAQAAAGDVKMRQYARIEGFLKHPETVTVRVLQVRVLDAAGQVRASHTQKL
jgi:hypothetical protein